MNPDYLSNVRRFGSSTPANDNNGAATYLSHKVDIDPNLLQLDGYGNVESVPLVWKKPCFGRPERYARGAMGGEPWYDDNGEFRLGKTTCDACLEKTPGTHEACGMIIDERIASAPAVDAAFVKWLTACATSGLACFSGARSRLWNKFLLAITDHGGWLNVNDDQVKFEAIRVEAEKKKRQKLSRQKRSRRQKDARYNRGTPITRDYLDKLECERDKRAAQLKGWRTLSGRSKRDMLWLKMLNDMGCDRVAEVWRTREELRRLGHEPQGQAIAKAMSMSGTWPLSLPSLAARVYEDLGRLAKLESNIAGSPPWPKWLYQ